MTGRGALRLWPLFAGVAVLAALWAGPLPEMSRTAFSMHMILHLGVVALAAPLLAIGIARWGLDLDGLRRPALWAIAASVFEMAVVWSWHAPALHEAAARHAPVFAVQQASFLAAGLGLWTIGFAARSRSGRAAAVVAFLMTGMHMTVLGVLLIAAPTLIYAPRFCLGAFGMASIEDQRLGGVLMAGWGSLAYFAGGLALCVRLLAPQEPASRGGTASVPPA